MGSVVTSPPPPNYNEAVSQTSDHVTEDPPTYNETISRIRKQLPKLSRSISVSAQKVGRQMSVKRPRVVTENPTDNSTENTVTGIQTSNQQGENGESFTAKKNQILPKRPPVNQSISMIEWITFLNVFKLFIQWMKKVSDPCS